LEFEKIINKLKKFHREYSTSLNVLDIVRLID